MLLWNINRKPFMGSPMALSNLTLSDLERSKSRSPNFWNLISRTSDSFTPPPLPRKIKPNYQTNCLWGEELIMLNSNIGPNIGDIISRKGAYFGRMLLLNINRKPYMGSPITLSNLTLSDLERSKSLRFWVVADLYGIHICLRLVTTLIWMSQKRIFLVAGFSVIPAVNSC